MSKTGQPKDAAATAQSVRDAMSTIEKEVRDSYDAALGHCVYRKGSRGVTQQELLRRAGGISRSVFAQPYHAALKKAVADWLEEMQKLTSGDTSAKREAVAVRKAGEKQIQLEEMADRLFAAQYENIRLKSENEKLFGKITELEEQISSIKGNGNILGFNIFGKK